VVEGEVEQEARQIVQEEGEEGEEEGRC